MNLKVGVIYLDVRSRRQKKPNGYRHDVSALPSAAFAVQEQQNNAILNLHSTDCIVRLKKIKGIPRKYKNHYLQLTVELIGICNTASGDIAVDEKSVDISRIMVTHRSLSGNDVTALAADQLAIKRLLARISVLSYELTAARMNSTKRKPKRA